MLWRTAVFIAAALLVVPGVLVRADGPPAGPAAALAALKEEHRKADEESTRAYDAAKTEAERKEVFEKDRKRRAAVVARAVELARKDPKDPAALEALTWVTTGGLGYFPETDAAFDLLARDHLASDKLDMVCAYAGLYSHADAPGAFLRAVLEKSPHRTMQGIACLSLARYTKYRAGQARYEKRPEADRLEKEAEGLYEKAVARYADVPFRERTVGDRAGGALFEMRNLVVGKVAPDVEGEDVEGKKFRLSDYRGKVVVLDFWGHW
jgi:hypothetical protein